VFGLMSDNHPKVAYRLFRWVTFTDIMPAIAARVAKLVDAADLKSAGYCDRAGSNPALGTILILWQVTAFPLYSSACRFFKYWLSYLIARMVGNCNHDDKNGI
jgi:hypothetical protein